MSDGLHEAAGERERESTATPAKRTRVSENSLLGRNSGFWRQRIPGCCCCLGGVLWGETVDEVETQIVPMAGALRAWVCAKIKANRWFTGDWAADTTNEQQEAGSVPKNYDQ